MKGFIRSPWLATLESAVMSWMAVTEIPWPKAMVAASTLVHFSTGRRSPLTSPGRSIPVLAPNPNLRMYWENLSLPSFSAILIDPILLEYLRISCTLRAP